MKTKIQSYQCALFIGFTALVVQSCSRDFFNKTITLGNDDYVKSLVLNCYIHQDDDIYIAQVGQNLGITQTTTDTSFYLPGATVEFLKNGQVQKVMKYDGQGQFKLSGNLPKLETGIEYGIRVKHPGFPDAVASSVMPAPVRVDSVTYTEKAGVNQFGESLSRIEVVFQDDPATTDYYAVSISRKFEYAQPVIDQNGMIVRYDTIEFFNNYPAEEPRDPASAEGLDGELVFSDRILNGQTYRFKYTFTDFAQGSDEPLGVRFRHITRDEYLYRVSQRQRQKTDDFPLAEPIIVHSNVKDGIGVFGLSWIKYVEIE